MSFHLALQLSNFLQSRIMSFEFISWLQLHFLSWKRLNNHPTLSFIVGMDSSSLIEISSFVFGLSLPFMLRFSDQNSLSLFTNLLYSRVLLNFDTNNSSEFPLLWGHLHIEHYRRNSIVELSLTCIVSFCFLGPLGMV